MVDSEYVSSLSGTAKADLFADEGLEMLKDFAAERATVYVQSQRDERSKTFIQQVREEPAYHFKQPPRTTLERVEQGLYDQLLVLMNEAADVAGAQPAMKQMLLRLAWRLVRSNDDLVEVLNQVLGLEEP